jgi:transcriptional regulator with XRE-family HTH domain
VPTANRDDSCTAKQARPVLQAQAAVRFEPESPQLAGRCRVGWFRLFRMRDDDDAMLTAFGEFVRAQRKLAKVSQRNLARMSGVSDSYLSQLERGNYRPSPQVVKALAQAFGLEPRQLYTMLGFIDDEDGESKPSVEQAIQLDERLQPSQKETLIRVYRSLLGED